MGFLDPQGPLFERLSKLSPVTTQQVSQALVEAVAKGWNPTKTAAMLQNQYGMALTDALRMTRTSQLYSYRESSRASYAANSDVLTGWQWHANLDGLTCMACTAQHGSIHPMNERLNGHHNCRCAMLPITEVFGAHMDEAAGQQWFEGLGEAEQKKMMGAGKFQLWKEGKITLDQLVDTHTDSVYGEMLTENSLKTVLRRAQIYDKSIRIGKKGT